MPKEKRAGQRDTLMTAEVRFDLVGPGVYRAAVPLPAPLGSANSYLLFDAGEAVLVDTAWVRGGDWRHIPVLLDRAGVDAHRMGAVIATHSHVDHLGHAPSVQGAWETPVLIHPLEATTSAWAGDESRDEFERWLASHGVPPGYLAGSIASLNAVHRPLVDQLPLYDMATIAVGATTWQAVHTPGHSPGHLCLFREADRMLISGDHLLEHVSPNVSAFPFQPVDPLGGYLRALGRVADLRPSLVLPGHGEPFTDVDGVVASQEAHHAQRLAEALAALTLKPLSAFAVAMAIPWTGRRRRFGELTGAHRFLAFGETLAHLEHLAQRGDVHRVRSDGLVTWSRVA